MKLFIRQLIQELTSLGHNTEARSDGIFIQGCRLYVEKPGVKYHNRRGSVRFLGEIYHQPYDRSKAAHAALLKLPELIEEAKKDEEEAKLQRKTRDLNEFLNGTGVNLYYSPYSKEYQITLGIKDQAAALACVDLIQDSGFLTDKAGYPEQPYPEICRRNQLWRMWCMLTKEERQAFLQRLIDSTETEKKLDEQDELDSQNPEE